jgi:predicted dehydrogenase
MASDPLRLGIVGVGTVVLRGVLPHLVMDDVADRVQVTALCDPVLERAQAAAREHNVPAAYASIEELLADERVDAVSIASPIGMHYEQGKQALLAGKHVHFNKTMTTSVAEADELIELARASELRIVASPGEVLKPQITRTRELVASGAIGEVAWVICGGAAWLHHESEPERTQALGGAAINPAWYFRKPGGGPLYDITIYALHQLTSILGAARSVSALSAIRIPERSFMDTTIEIEADDNTVLLLDFGNGLFAVAHGTVVGTISEQWGAGTYFGTKGTIDGLLLNGEPFDFPGRERMRGRPVDDWQAQTWVLPDVNGAHRDVLESHVFQDVMQLVDSVREGTPSVVSAEHARHVIDIIESGYRAAETGQKQELTTSFELPESR